MQISDSGFLNFMWRYSLRIYGHTNKTNYKKGCIQQAKILFDSEPKTKAIIKYHRTYNDTGRPCAGGAIDMKNEKACPCYAPAPIASYPYASNSDQCCLPRQMLSIVVVSISQQTLSSPPTRMSCLCFVTITGRWRKRWASRGIARRVFAT